MLLHVIIFVHVNTIDFMSGSAALSAARKRRASNAPMGNNGAPPSYYNRGQNPNGISSPIAPGINAGPPFGNEQSRFVQPFPPQPMNIYENIDLIKQQLAERTKLIQTQGSSIPPDKIKILHKQNEIQTQILKQKIAIAKQMESVQQESNVYDHKGFAPSVSGALIPEPEFIYERGVPQRNPKYKGAGMGTGGMTTPNVGMQKSNSGGLQVSPFVTMISDTGVIPPPIVIIKSHDVKLEEHNYVLHEVVQQLSELQAKVNRSGSGSGSGSSSSADQASAKMFSKENKVRHDEQYQDEDDEGEDGEEDEELLMDVVMNDLTNSREFVESIVNKIVTETNLSEVIMKIEPLVKENQELRSLIHSQQQMMNEMNTTLLRLLNQGNTPTKPETYQDNGLDSDGLYQMETTEIILSHSDTKKVDTTSEDNNSETSPTFPSLQVTEDDLTSHIQINSGVVNIDISDDGLVAESNDNNTQSNEKTDDEPASEPVCEPMNIEFTSAPIDDYSSPNFSSDPISLIVNEIQ